MSKLLGVIMSNINDFKTRAENDFWEYTIILGNEPRMITNKEALWQGFVGELKTKPGECQGVGMENYGCGIWNVIGENINEMVLKEIENYVTNLKPHYEEIKDIYVNEVVEMHDGRVKLTITLNSIYGYIRGVACVG